MTTKILLTVLLLVIFGVQYFTAEHLLYDTTSLTNYPVALADIAERIVNIKIALTTGTLILLTAVWTIPNPKSKEPKNGLL